MLPGHLNIVLFQPEIPQNTGNIARLAAATGCRLHLILPLGFATDDKQLRRPGLDYWPYLDLEVHDSFATFAEGRPPDFAFLSKSADRTYNEIPASVDTLIFGQETSGLPETFRQDYPDHFYRIPMFHTQVRSLNLANATAILTYNQLQKRGLI